MAIKHKRVVKPGDVGLAEDWNADHLIEEETIKLEHLDKAIRPLKLLHKDYTTIDEGEEKTYTLPAGTCKSEVLVIFNGWNEDSCHVDQSSGFQIKVDVRLYVNGVEKTEAKIYRIWEFEGESGNFTIWIHGRYGDFMVYVLTSDDLDFNVDNEIKIKPVKGYNNVFLVYGR